MNTPDIPKVPSHDIQNEVQDFSLKKQMCPKGGNKLDDTLSKLMKRKNCPIEEPVVGKEKKRRKLDEIVLGLSAAKEQMLYPETTKKSAVTPSVTVTPTSAPLSTAHHPKPFTITVTSIPSPAPPRSCATPNLKTPMPTKDSFSNFLAQAEQQNLLLKKQQQQQKSYEAMIADINKVADFSSKVNSYSHEAKVNKWLAEQNAALAEQPLNADYLAPRRRRPRVDPSLLDWKKLTGNENVSVIHRVTNKKLTGPKAPTLKRLGQWLMENPMYDIDPKWAELVKERGNLGHDFSKRFGNSSKKSNPGRPPLLSSPTGSTSSVSSANLATSLSSTLPFPSLAGSSLSGLNSSLLSGLSGLSQFDAKNAIFDPKNPLFDPKNPLFDPKNNPLFDPKNPLLMPFASGMPNINALNSMAGLGNLGNMNLFANLAGLGLPGLGMDPTGMTPTEAPKPKTSTGCTSSSNESKSKSQKPIEAHSSSKPTVTSSAASLPTSSPFPFFFPNPSLLYTPLGLGGLNPFALQPGMSAAYDSLAQQCTLLNGNLNPAASPNSSSKSNKSSNRTPSATSTTTATSQSKSPRPSRDSHLQNLILPPDTQLLESISKVAGSLEPSIKHKLERKDDKQKALDSLRGMLPSDFTSNRCMKDIPSFADFNKLLEASQVSTPALVKKTRDYEMKEAIEKLSKSNAELLAHAMVEEQHHLAPSGSIKRPRESVVSNELPEKFTRKEEENSPKRLKESFETTPPLLSLPIPSVAIPTGDVDIETLLPPSTVVKSNSCLPPTEIAVEEKQLSPQPDIPLVVENPEPPPPPVSTNATLEPVATQPEVTETSEPIVPKKNTKRTRGKRRSGEIPLDPETVIERKNLRSSASRSAAVAAARAAAEAAAKQLEAENALKNQEADSV